MTKKINTKLAKYYSLINYNLIYDNQSINRYKNKGLIIKGSKKKHLDELINSINNIKNCSLKKNATNLVFSDGNPDSKIASDTYVGKTKPGGGEDGLSLSINGWKWDNPPSEKRITHSGEIKFKFVVDEYGEVRSIKVLSSSFTPSEEQMLKEKLEQVIFLQTTSGRAPEYTEGTLVWEFRAK